MTARRPVLIGLGLRVLLAGCSGAVPFVDGATTTTERSPCLDGAGLYDSESWEHDTVLGTAYVDSDGREVNDNSAFDPGTDRQCTDVAPSDTLAYNVTRLGGESSRPARGS